MEEGRTIFPVMNLVEMVPFHISWVSPCNQGSNDSQWDIPVIFYIMT